MSPSHLLLPQATPPSPNHLCALQQAIQSCSAMSELKQLHGHLLKLGLSSDNDAMGRVIKFCSTSKHGDLGYALKVFDTMPKPDAFLYNTLMKGFLQNEPSRMAILVYLHMMEESAAVPNHFTFPCVIRACCDDFAIEEGRQAHAHVLKFGFGEDEFALNNLIHMYVNFQRLEDARRVFDNMARPNVVSCTTLISGYAKQELIDHALQVFESVPEKSSVLWNAMIAAYVQNNAFIEALSLFDRMLKENVMLDKFVASSVLSACAGLGGALEIGKWVHDYVKRAGIELDSKLATSIIDMYCKCGCLASAIEFFHGLPRKNISKSSWNCMIGGMAIHGRGEEAIGLFKEMEKEGTVIPDHITFLNVLTACAHSGLVEEGRYYFRYMKTAYGVEPKREHYGCMVDLLGRSGRLNEAMELIDTMPMNPDSSALGALLGACRIHKNVELGARIGKRLIELDPGNSGRYVLLANLYADFGRLPEAAQVRNLMNDRGVKKLRGCSVIEFGGTMNEFIAGERTHPDSELVYVKLEEMIRKIQKVGYVPNTKQVLLHDLDNDDEEEEEEMGRALFYHSEKLAIAFGLLKTRAGETVQIRKNLRICRDCHCAAKLISKVFDREIVMRDTSRFHHFRSGECSCKDYW